MIQKRFSLRFLFIVVTAACVVAWAISAPSIERWLAAVILLSLIGSCLGYVRGMPISYGAVAGAGAVVALVLCYWPIHVTGYFYHSGPEPYFEDGVGEIFVFPIIYCIIYAPVGALLGTFAGCIVELLSRVVLLKVF